jgi:hypothetical protein
MKRQERRGLEGEGSLSNSPWTEEDRPESAQQPVARRQVRSALASTAQDDQLLLEQQVLRHHRSYTTGATELRGHDGEVKQGEQEVPHLRVSVGQTSGAAQHCQTLDSAREFSIRDAQAAAGSMIQFAGNLSQVSAKFCLIQFGERQEMTAANALDRVFSRDG